MEHLSNDHEGHPNQWIVIKLTMKQDILFWVYWKVNENWDNNMIMRSQHDQWESHFRTNTRIWRKKEIQKSMSGIWVGKLTISVRLFEIGKLLQSSPVYQFHQNRLAGPYDGSREWVDQENFIYVRRNRFKNCIMTKKGIDRGKRSKTLSEVKPVENIFDIDWESFRIKGRWPLTEKLPELIESSKFVSHRARTSGEIDSRKYSHSAQLEWRPQVFVKLSFTDV